MNYNYVFFNARDCRNPKKNLDGYYRICLKDLESLKNALVVSHPLDSCNLVMRFLFDLHYSEKVNRLVDLPFKNIWFPKYFKNPFKDDKPICFVFIDPYVSEEYYAYLKDTFKDCRIVALHRDSINVWKNAKPHFIKNPLFDLEMSFDPYEAKKYHMVHFDEFESKISVPFFDYYPESDVFFAGKAKDRLQRLLLAYDIFTKAKLKCFFFITGVNQEEQVQKQGIVYSDKPMSYREMLEHSVNSRCLLEINQKGLSGYTSRFLEAVMYNKRLISDNCFIKTTRFYNKEYIQIIDDVSNIDASFVMNQSLVDYEYNNEFSPLRLIKQIDDELIKLS